MIDQSNWGHCAYQVGQHQVMIGPGASGSAEGLYREIYSVNIFTEDFELRFQRSFGDLDSAISYINERYSRFTLTDKSEPSSGCASCANHS